MPRKNLAGTWSGESRRLTMRREPRDLLHLDELAIAWQSDPSEVLRRAVREAAAVMRRRRHQERLDGLPTMSVAGLRGLAADLAVSGRSKMGKAELQAALRARLLTLLERRPMTVQCPD